MHSLPPRSPVPAASASAAGGVSRARSPPPKPPTLPPGLAQPVDAAACPSLPWRGSCPLLARRSRGRQSPPVRSQPEPLDRPRRPGGMERVPPPCHSRTAQILGPDSPVFSFRHCALLDTRSRFVPLKWDSMSVIPSYDASNPEAGKILGTSRDVFRDKAPLIWPEASPEVVKVGRGPTRRATRPIRRGGGTESRRRAR